MLGKRKSLSKKLRFEILKRDNFTCQYCGRAAPEVKLHVDHIKPVAKGGTNHHANLIAACIDCNYGKSDRLIEDSSIKGTLSYTQIENRYHACQTAHETFGGVNETIFYDAYDQLFGMGVGAGEIYANLEEAGNLLQFSNKVAYYRDEVFI